VKFAFLALLIGILSGLLLPPAAFKEAMEGMLTFLGLVFASVVPAMALTVSTLRASRRSVREVKLLRRALDEQLRFWITFLGVTAAGAVVLLAASAIGWPQEKLFTFKLRQLAVVLTPMTFFNAAIMFLLTLILGKAPAFARGMRDLLHLHLDQVEAESLASLQIEHDVVTEAIAEKRKFDDPSFGKLIGSDKDF
jgi:hypothetical protein